jgi:hypothetical protein
MTEIITRIQAYLDELEAVLKGSDPAVVMDAANDAGEYLYNEVDALLEANPEMKPEDAVVQAMEKFGSPEEVARSFLDMEAQVDRAFRLGRPEPPRSALNRFFGITREPRAYAALLYMVIAIFLAVLHIFWVGYGVPLAVVSCIFIIGIPISLFYMGSLRALTLVELRLIESLLGIRMPRRPIFVKTKGNVLTLFVAMVRDAYTWKTILYLVLMVPAGAVYGVLLFALLGAVAELMYLPLFPDYSDLVHFIYGSGSGGPGPWGLTVTLPLAFLVYTCILHFFVILGRTHARITKRFMVGRSPDA